jgi:hypothetical protein
MVGIWICAIPSYSLSSAYPLGKFLSFYKNIPYFYVNFYLFLPYRKENPNKIHNFSLVCFQILTQKMPKRLHPRLLLLLLQLLLPLLLLANSGTLAQQEEPPKEVPSPNEGGGGAAEQSPSVASATLLEEDQQQQQQSKCGTKETDFAPCVGRERADEQFKHCCSQYVPAGCQPLCQYEPDELTARNMVRAFLNTWTFLRNRNFIFSDKKDFPRGVLLSIY